MRRVKKAHSHPNKHDTAATAPFNISNWGGERLRDDKRWQYGAPPTGSWPTHNETRPGSFSS